METERRFVETLLSEVRSRWSDGDGGYLDATIREGADFAAYVRLRLALADAPRDVQTWRRSREADQHDAAFVVEMGAEYLLEVADLGEAEKAMAQKLVAFSAWARVFEDGYMAGVQDTIMEDIDQTPPSA